MKKSFLLLILGLALLVTLTACSKTPLTNKGQNGQGINNDSERTIETAKGPLGPRMPDFGQPDKTPDIQGIIKSVVGNEVTVLKVEVAFAGGRASSTSRTASSSDSAIGGGAPAISLGATGSMGRPTGGGEMPGGGRGGNVAGGGVAGENADSRAQMLAKLKEMSTGEETITIPVGIQMLKSSTNTDNGKREMVEASIADLSADKTITVWLNAAVTDKKVAEFVLIN